MSPGLMRTPHVGNSLVEAPPGRATPACAGVERARRRSVFFRDDIVLLDVVMVILMVVVVVEELYGELRWFSACVVMREVARRRGGRGRPPANVFV